MAMTNLWSEFKTFALSGNMLDLALGFIIGAAFSAVVQSLAGNVLMQLVAAVAGEPDFGELVLTVNGARIRYGAFLTDLVRFALLAAVLFALVKVIKRAGLSDFGRADVGDCPYCKEPVALDAIKCRWCTQDLVAELPGPGDAERLAELSRRRRGVEPAG
jgi:large conductance mechanosensitive channel